MAKKTLCGECIHLDYNKQTKDGDNWYYCKEHNCYRNTDRNTCCEQWVSRIDGSRQGSR